MSNSKYSIFIIFSGIIIACGRLLMNNISSISSINDKYILIVMAVFNYIALGFVFAFLLSKLSSKCIQEINDSGSFTAKKNKCKALVNIILLFFLIIYLVLGYLYMFFYKTSARNDAISILALTISIGSDGLVKDGSKLLYKITLKAVDIIEKERKPNNK